jgi:hypothetical protein
MNPYCRTSFCFLGSILLALPALSLKAETLDDLKKLDIICFVPSYLPKGFELKEVEITYDEDSSEQGKGRKVPMYSIEWTNADGSGFSIDSAWEGIGDRNLMETEDSDDADFQSKMFDKVFFIYTPKGKDSSGVKKEIRSNWVEDANMKAEQKKNPHGHPVLGRYHGFTGTKMTVADFEKIIDSLHPVNASEKGGAGAPAKPEALKIHPKVFNMIDCWISDSESPVVTEISLDAMDKNGNQFNDDDLKPDGEWTRALNPDSKDGFMRYRVLESKGNHYKVEYQENGGGTLTTASIIEFDIQKRTIQRDGKPASIRVLRVSSYAEKK